MSGTTLLEHSEKLTRMKIHTYAESEQEVVRGEPLPDNFRKRQITPKIIHRWKGNLSEMPIHFRYWKKFGLRKFMSDFRGMVEI